MRLITQPIPQDPIDIPRLPRLSLHRLIISIQDGKFPTQIIIYPIILSAAIYLGYRVGISNPNKIFEPFYSALEKLPSNF